MIIGIDANWLIYENAGIGKYSYFLIREILRQDKKNRYVLFANFIRHYKKRRQILLDLIKESKNKKCEIYISKIPSAWRDALSQTNVPIQWIYRKKVDLYFSSYFSGIFNNGFNKQIVVIYDLVFVHHWEHAGKKLSAYYLKRSIDAVEHCQKIIAISRSTQNDIEQSLGVDESKITIAYPGVDRGLFKKKSQAKCQIILDKYHIVKPYLLSVCTLEPRKNLESLLVACELLPHSFRKKYQLVLVGKSGWNNESLLNKINNFVNDEFIVTTGYVLDQDLPYLYSGAKIFVYPSVYEGFGMPPLEAMACGCPVIVSNKSSLPEVVGKAGILVEPTPTAISSAIIHILENNELAIKLSKKGILQAKKFIWKISAQKIIKEFGRLK